LGDVGRKLIEGCSVILFDSKRCLLVCACVKIVKLRAQSDSNGLGFTQTNHEAYLIFDSDRTGLCTWCRWNHIQTL